MARFTNPAGSVSNEVPFNLYDNNNDQLLEISKTGTGTTRIETIQDDLSLRSARDITLYAGTEGPGKVYINWGDAVYTPNSTNEVATLANFVDPVLKDHVSFINNDDEERLYVEHSGTGTARIVAPLDDLSLRSARDITLYPGSDGPGNVYIGWGDAGYEAFPERRVATIEDTAKIPQTYYDATENYALQATDAGKHIYMVNNYAIIVPTDNTLNFPIGTTIVLVSTDNSAGVVCEDSGTTSVWGAGYGETDAGSGWYITNRSMATLLKTGANEWMLSGATLTSGW
jgi:hypothetical protein